MRKIILYILGALLLVVAYFGAQYIIANSEQPKPQAEEIVKTVFVENVKNKTVPIVITATGNLIAKNRLELYSEVQGVFRSSARDFKAGQPYKKGETLIRMDAAEYYASVQAARSEFYNLVTSLMPDLRLDYPEAFKTWEQYLTTIDINKSLPALPQVTNEKLNYFITGRGVNSSYYNIKNMEQRLGKFSIVAPFSGIVTEAMVTRGTLIRSGQKLGEFIDTSSFEVQLSIGKEFSDLLEIGEKVSLSTIEGSREFTGTVSRINGRIDQATQTISVFVTVVAEGLKEGMYVQAYVDARDETDAIEIPRKLLVNESQVYVVRDSVLDLIPANPVYFSAKNVVLKGIPDGTKLLSRSIPGAYAGMKVKYLEDSPQSAGDTPVN
ncbi:efflux transporter periplasmic adaptor subunit [Pukyongia salina]|uniref:Efflux transporter periplasmic adaptor subunit n=1 Tax=Pukyongia salina TaxID=2094025 RepID=A0A2S0HWS8_9FLAO|nr:HlyD family efflux transporter periplasmic adaptor subunit [Pukyongia salina]AVI51109.1 efflux transporter periplasmic adaptor subunit [Pukyongia salina]